MALNDAPTPATARPGRASPVPNAVLMMVGHWAKRVAEVEGLVVDGEEHAMLKFVAAARPSTEGPPGDPGAVSHRV